MEFKPIESIEIQSEQWGYLIYSHFETLAKRLSSMIDQYEPRSEYGMIVGVMKTQRRDIERFLRSIGTVQPPVDYVFPLPLVLVMNEAILNAYERWGLHTLYDAKTGKLMDFNGIPNDVIADYDGHFAQQLARWLWSSFVIPAISVASPDGHVADIQAFMYLIKPMVTLRDTIAAKFGEMQRKQDANERPATE